MRKRILFLILPFLIVLVSFLLYYKKDYIIFPHQKKDLTFYSDMNAHKEGKTARPEHFISDSALNIRFTLEQGFQYPYAGMIFPLDSADLSDYDILKVNLKASVSKSLKLIFHLPYYKDPEARYPFRILENEIPLDNEYQETSLEKFSTPGWWYRKNKVNEKEAGALNFTKTLSFLIQSGNSTPVGKEELVVIRSVSLSQNLFPFWLTTFIFLTAYYGVYIVVAKMRKRNRLTIVPYKELEIKENSEDEKLISYLSVHYNDPDISIEKLNRELGISASRIPVIIKAKSGISFKQYLNFIRIKEAKRLLKTTDQQITQIAYAVGYNTITHFNKVFREIENISPKEYRIKEKVSKSDLNATSNKT